MGKVHSKRSVEISSTPKKGAVDVPAKVRRDIWMVLDGRTLANDR